MKDVKNIKQNSNGYHQDYQLGYQMVQSLEHQ